MQIWFWFEKKIKEKNVDLTFVLKNMETNCRFDFSLRKT